MSPTPGDWRHPHPHQPHPPHHSTHPSNPTTSTTTTTPHPFPQTSSTPATSPPQYSLNTLSTHSPTHLQPTLSPYPVNLPSALNHPFKLTLSSPLLIPPSQSISKLTHHRDPPLLPPLLPLVARTTTAAGTEPWGARTRLTRRRISLMPLSVMVGVVGVGRHPLTHGP